MTLKNKRIIRYTIGVILCFSIAFHITTTVHELLGHGLAAELFGQKITDFKISFCGGSGYIAWSGPQLTECERLVVEWAGIIATLGVGIIVWWVWNNWFVYTLWLGMLLWSIAVSSVMSGLGYTVLGIHYGYGDMRNTAQFLTGYNLKLPVVVAGTLVSVMFMFLICRKIILIQKKWVDIDSWKWQTVCAFCIIGGAAGLNAGADRLEMHITSRQSYRTIMTHEKVRKAEKSVVEENKKRRGNDKPELTRKEEQRFVKKKQKEYEPWPLVWMYLPLVGVGAFLGMWHGRDMEGELKRSSKIPLWLIVLFLVEICAGGLTGIIW